MKQQTCGCTGQNPGCEVGQQLFAVADHLLHTLSMLPVHLRNEQWLASHMARLAYLDHVDGWQEGDLKVRGERGIWMVYARLGGQWIWWFGTQDARVLRMWLRDRGYRQQVPISSDLPGIQMPGCYRRLAVEDQPHSSAKQQEAPARLDLKTQVTMRIALLVASCPGQFSLQDRLYVQQCAASLLLSHNIPIGPDDERAIAGLIDEALLQKEALHAMLPRTTRMLSR